MTKKKVASITCITDEVSFRIWLEGIPYHISEPKKSKLWNSAKYYNTALWTSYWEKQDLEDWITFF